MTESTQTHEIFPNGRAIAKCHLVGLAMMVVGACWFFRFLPYLFAIPLYFDPNAFHFFDSSNITRTIIKIVMSLVGLGILACSYQVFKQRRYGIALLAPMTCLLLFVFPCSTLLLTYHHCSNNEVIYENLDYLDDGYGHPWYHLMDEMIPTEQVVNIASCFADYTPRYYMDIRHHPKVEIPIQIVLYFLAPTTLIGIFGFSTLLTSDTRRLFTVPPSQRVKISVADAKVQHDYFRGLSRAYAVLMFLLLIAILPITLLDFVKPERYDYLMPPVNVYLNYAIVVCMMLGIVSYFTRRYYAFALLTPIAWIASSAYFRWSIEQQYEWLVSGTYNYYDLTALGFYSTIFIVLISRLTFGGLGVWIWWKNQKRPGSTG